MNRESSIIRGCGGAGLIGMLLMFSVSIAQANDVENSVTVSTSSPPPAVGFNEGSGDGLNWAGTGDTKRLKVTLNAPANKEIKCASQTVISEGIAWDCADWDTWAASHLYTSALITPKDFFRPLFSGPIRGGAGGPGGGPPPTWYAGVIQADIQGDADNDSTTAQRPPATAEAERKEEEVAEQGGEGNPTGLIVPLNRDYHEGDPNNQDYAHAGIVTSDPDLVKARVVLKLPDEVRPDSKVKLTYNNSKLLVYKSSDPNTAVASGTQYDVTAFGTDLQLLIEGVAASAVSGGDSIQVTLTPKSGDVSRDKTVVTVVFINLDAHEAGYLGDTISEKDEENPGLYSHVNWNDDDWDGWTGDSSPPDSTYTPDKDDDHIWPTDGSGTTETDFQDLDPSIQPTDLSPAKSRSPIRQRSRSTQRSRKRSSRATTGLRRELPLALKSTRMHYRANGRTSSWKGKAVPRTSVT